MPWRRLEDKGPTRMVLCPVVLQKVNRTASSLMWVPTCPPAHSDGSTRCFFFFFFSVPLNFQGHEDIYGNIFSRISITFRSSAPCWPTENRVNCQTFLERVLQTEVRFSENPRFVSWNRFWSLFFKASPLSPHADDRKFSPELWFIRYLNRCSYLNINPIINFKFMLTWYPDLGS